MRMRKIWKLKLWNTCTWRCLLLAGRDLWLYSLLRGSILSHSCRTNRCKWHRSMFDQLLTIYACCIRLLIFASTALISHQLFEFVLLLIFLVIGETLRMFLGDVVMRVTISIISTTELHSYIVWDALWLFTLECRLIVAMVLEDCALLWRIGGHLPLKISIRILCVILMLGLS